MSFLFSGRGVSCVLGALLFALLGGACGSTDEPQALNCPAGQSLNEAGNECVDDPVECDAQFFGPDCRSCDCLYGTCQDGREGDGSCSCEQGWLGERCDEPDPLDPPAAMRLTVDKDRELRTFVLDRYSVRVNSGLRMKVVTEQGAEDVDVDPAIRTYRGWCEEESDSAVSAMLLPSGALRYHVFKGDPSRDWSFIPKEEIEEAPPEINYVVVGGQAKLPSAVPLEGASFTAAGAPDDPFFHDAYRDHMAVIISKDYLTLFSPKDWHTVVRKVESTLARMNATYLRDLLTETQVSEILIRSDVMTDWDVGRADFESFFPDARPNNVFTVTDEKGAGLAYVCQLGGSTATPQQNRYAVGKVGPADDGTFYGVIRHEYGHNLGSGHYEGGAPEGPTILSGNSLSRLSSYEVEVMMDCRRPGGGGEATRYAEKLGPYKDYLVPPYARLDDKITASLGGKELNLDVMANDHDANGDSIALAAIDPQSALGGEITMIASGSSTERDTVQYAPPSIALDQITVGSCAPGERVSVSDCQSCEAYFASGPMSCATTGECGTGEVCVGGRCRQAPGCDGNTMVDPCGRPCPRDDLMVWLDAADAENVEDANGDRGVALQDGTEITTWFDRSGSGTDAIAYADMGRPSLVTAGAEQIAGRATMRFETDIMELRTADVRPETHEAITSLAVVRHVTGDGGKMIWVQAQNGFNKRAHTAKGSSVDTVSLTTALFDASTGRQDHWLSGIPQSGAAAMLDSGGATIALGALLYPNEGSEGHYHTNMILAELLLYSRPLSDAERREIEFYLVKKWGITLSDRFMYSIADSSGMRGDGFVMIDLQQ